ncbi:hypothetical protein ACFLZP_04295 [Patescibacteria group bacterium]
MQVLGGAERWGCDKHTYQVAYGSRLLAAKKFRSTFKERDARVELAAYQLFFRTSLGPYIPKPYGLLQGGKGKAVGFLVDWREGVPLEYSALKLLTPADVAGLETAFLDVGPVLPDLDMAGPNNVCFSTRYLPRIWLAECAKAPNSMSINEYRESVHKEMEGLRRKYVRG